VTDVVTTTLVSQPLIDLVALPEGVEDLYGAEPEKYEFAKRKWWQGRWEIYVFLISAFLIYWIYDACAAYKAKNEEKDSSADGKAK